MTEYNNQSLTDTIKSLTQAFFKTVKDTASLAGAEAKLAGKSLINIALLLIVLRALAFLTWISICAVLALYLLSLGYTWLTALAAVTLLNVIAIAVVVVGLLRLKRNLSFPATRRQLQAGNNFDQDFYNEQTKIENKIS